ncbi:MAG TPA: hypothetical protein VM096_07765 [Vicinamibacterales bacterium]|nr:hypothetical protein [Vicinamibacterales bacterium]
MTLLKLSLKRGALVTAANWQVVVVQFVADTLFKTLIAVPVVGGLVLVALVVGGNPLELLRFDDLTQTISSMVSVLLAQPVALVAFAAALGIVVAGGSIMMFAVKAGTVTVLLAGDRSAGTIELPPLRLSALREANQTTLERFTNGVRNLFFRYLRLGMLLTVAYAIIGVAYLLFVFGPSMPQSFDNPLTVTLASLSVLVGITLLNFLYLLMQIVMAAEDCGVLDAFPHVARLVRRRTKELGQVLAAILALMVMATGASILATTQLGLISFVPFIGLAALPLQVFAWLVRGVVFQYVGLTGVSTYVRMHFALRSAPVGVHTPTDGLRQVTRA